MLFKSSLISEASGSVGGSTYSRNRYGMYIRNRSIPVQPNTDRQAAAKSRFSQASARWNEFLTQAQRTAWNLYGASVAMLNKLGDTIYLSGYSHYIRSNCQQLQVLATVVDAGPTTFSLPNTDSNATVAISEATQLLTITFTASLPWVDEDGAFLQAEISIPRIAGREFLGGPFRYAGAIEGDLASPPTSPQTMAVPFVCTEGQKVEVRLRIGRADGRLSAPFSFSISVAA